MMRVRERGPIRDTAALDDIRQSSPYQELSYLAHFVFAGTSAAFLLPFAAGNAEFGAGNPFLSLGGRADNHQIPFDLLRGIIMFLQDTKISRLNVHERCKRTL